MIKRVLAVVFIVGLAAGLGYLNAGALWGGGPILWLMTGVFAVTIGLCMMAR